MTDFTRLFKVLSLSAHRHAHVARTMTLAAMVMWYANTADLANGMAPANSNQAEERQKKENAARLFAQNRNEIYGYGMFMPVLPTVQLPKPVSKPVQDFRKAKPIVMVPDGDFKKARFATNVNLVEKAGQLPLVYEDVVEEPEVKTKRIDLMTETNVIYMSQYRNTA